MEETIFSGKRHGASGYVQEAHWVQQPVPSASTEPSEARSASYICVKWALCAASTSIIASKSKLSSTSPTVCTKIPLDIPLSFCLQSSREPQPGGQLQHFPYLPQELVAHISRTSCLSTMVLTSNVAQWLNPAAWAHAANCASFILPPPKMKGRPQTDLETPADWPIPKIPWYRPDAGCRRNPGG